MLCSYIRAYMCIKLILKKGNRKTCPLPYLKKKQLPK
nr:MAG TPA: hypothetical protein [Caudoviricetes sp.]